MNIQNTLIDSLPKTVSTETSFYGWKEGRTWKGFFHDLYQLFFKCNQTNSSTFTLDDVKNGYVNPEFFAKKVVTYFVERHSTAREERSSIEEELTLAFKTQMIWDRNFQVSTVYPSLSIFIEVIPKLNEWALAGTPEEDRAKAKERILDFLYSSEAYHLDLTLYILDLPDVFNHPSFCSRLKELNLNHSGLTSLPESFGRLGALQQLNLNHTRITSLPESFGSLGALQRLSLEATPLTSLPESFGSLGALQSLDLSHTRLRSLPESFGSLGALQRLSLGHTPLTSLPESFGSLGALQILDLEATPLTSLPESFGRLGALQILDLGDTPLTSLPESFGRLGALQILDLEATRLTSLPESFGSLRALKRLDLSHTRLTSLPESFGSLGALQRLSLGDTPLTSLPESFGSLRALQELHLSRTRLTSFPSTITSLSRTLEIDISSLFLSEEIRSRLQTATQAPGYNGPRFFYSMAHVERRREDLRSTVELVRDLYQELQEPPLTLSKELEESPNLRTWLSRLSYMADYQAGGENKKALVQNILAYLRLANEDPSFREVFLAIIQGAAETCGDRVALSILQIGIAYKVHTADITKPKDLAYLLLRGIYAITLLEDIAREKVSTLNFVDELEVYLGYPLKLKEVLELPIDIEEMLYFRCSALTDTDLRNAEIFVKKQLDSEDACTDFLIKHETWVKCLERNCRREFEDLSSIKETASEKAESDADYTKIQADYNKGLIALTKKALASFEVTSASMP